MFCYNFLRIFVLNIVGLQVFSQIEIKELVTESKDLEMKLNDNSVYYLLTVCLK